MVADWRTIYSLLCSISFRKIIFFYQTIIADVTLSMIWYSTRYINISLNKSKSSQIYFQRITFFMILYWIFKNKFEANQPFLFYINSLHNIIKCKIKFWHLYNKCINERMEYFVTQMHILGYCSMWEVKVAWTRQSENYSMRSDYED